MTDELKRFFKSIDYPFDENGFYGASVEKVIYLKQKDIFEVFLHFENVLSPEMAKDLVHSSKNKINHEKECVIYFSYNNITEADVLQYVHDCIQELVKKRPSLINLTEAPVSIEDEIITLEVSTKLEELEVKKEAKGIVSKLYSYGLGEYELTSILNETLNEEVKKDIEKNRIADVPTFEFVPPKKEAKPIEGEITAINNIMGDMKSVIIEALSLIHI